jgi:DNA-binding FrmR family transcriptional regulator
MVEEDRYCEDVLIQISAVINSLRSMSNEMLKSHLSTCVVDEIKKDNLEVIDEVVNLFNKIK